MARGYLTGVTYRFNVISNSFIYDLSAVVLIRLFMTKAKNVALA